MYEGEAAASRLNAVAIDNNGPAAEPVVFLHGFGGLAAQWRGLQTAISFDAPTLAFDLPGHGGSLEYPGFGPPKVAARAVLDDLEARRIGRAHLVGHSMGGAVASIIALIAPDRVASLTLLAPGGYGEEFNHPLLLRWAAASTAEDLSAVMPHFFAPSFELDRKFIEFQLAARARKGAIAALTSIAKGMSSDGRQGVLPVGDVLSADYPVTVLWGSEDAVLPVSQAHAIAGQADVRILDDVGHSPAEEAADQVRQAVLEQVRRN